VGPQVVAAIDAGTNSVHLLVAVVSRRRLRTIADDRVFVALGPAIERGHLGPAREVLVAALARFANVARDLTAQRIAILGTEPLRRVADADEVAAEVLRTTGIRFDIISHEEEGLLTLLGVTLGAPLDRTVLVADIGGGSSELVVAGPDAPPVTVGLRLGSARLIERYSTHDPPTWAEIAAMRAAAGGSLAHAPSATPDELVVVGGAATNLLRVLASAAEDRCLDARRIHRAVGRLLAEPAAVAAQRYGIHPARAHTLPAGAAVLMALLDHFGVSHLAVSSASLREGVAIALARSGTPGWREALSSMVGIAETARVG
jgi:exopolyphosphatase/guanosine-5'-triphosphate,3'-diphosphate pyrophosphatase